MAPIAVGDTIPDGKLSFLNEKSQLQTVSIYSLITGKKVLIFGVPGCFTPNSSWCLQPETIRVASKVHETLYICVNDPYVVWAWGKCAPRNGPHLKFLADSKAAYVTSLGLDLDLTSRGFGVRCKRFTMLLDDRKVDLLFESQIDLDPLPPLERPTPNASRAAPIAVGDIIPDGTLTFVNQWPQIEPVSVHSIVAGKKVIVLGVPGAFLRNCSKYLVKSFIRMADLFKSMGVQEILCISVNDPYVMRGWRRAFFSNTTKINFLADSTAAYVTSLGLVADLSRTVLGIRSMKFALLLDDLRVKVVEFRRPGTFDMLLAEDMLSAMARSQLRDACG